MNKLTRSWMVPVSSFALAVLLAMVAGPKSKALARDPGAGTGGGACVCDVKNFSYFTQVLVNDISAGGEYDFQYGIPATKTNNSVGNTCNVRVTYQVNTAGGISTRTLDVPLDPTPKNFRVDAKDVEETDKIRVDWKGSGKDLDKALKGAEHAVSKVPSETWIGETPGSRNPVLYKFNLHGRTATKGGGVSCTEDMTFTVPTPIDSSNTGIVTGLRP